jgi:hypothetical protein
LALLLVAACRGPMAAPEAQNEAAVVVGGGGIVGIPNSYSNQWGISSVWVNSLVFGFPYDAPKNNNVWEAHYAYTDGNQPVHIAWTPKNANLDVSIYQAVNTNSTVYVNGVAQGPAHWSPGGQITATVNFPVGPTQPYPVYLSVSMPGAYYNSSVEKISERNTSPFIEVYSTFKGPRCANCHSLGSSDAITSFHAYRGVSLAGINVKPDDSTACNICHSSFGGGIWRSPSFAKNMNWAAMPDATTMCNQLAANTGSANLWEHIATDPRVQWALTSGQVPLGHAALPLQTVPDPSDIDLLAMDWDNAGHDCYGLDGIR